MPKKQQVTIYKIDSTYVKGKFELRENTSFSKIIETIINSVPDKRKILKEVKLSRVQVNEFKIRLFFAQIGNPWEWPGFFDGKIDETNDVSQSFISTNSIRWPNLICFFYNSNNIYAICAGQGHHILSDYVEEFFGMSVLEKIAPKEKIDFSALRNRTVMGGVASSNRIFREKQKVWSEDTMGKIYKGANFSISNLSISDRDVLDLLSKSDDNTSKSSINISASNGIKFNRSYDINEISKIINFIDNLGAEQFSFSLIRPLSSSKSKNNHLKEHLTSILLLSIFGFIKESLDGNTDEIPLYEFSHKNYDLFYSCSKIQITRDSWVLAEFESPYGIDSKDILLKILEEDADYLRRKVPELADEIDSKKWKSVLARYKVRFFLDSDEVDSTELINCFFGEVADENRKYFFLDEQWFNTVDSFIPSIDQELEKLISTRRINIDFGINWGVDGSGNQISDSEDEFLHRLQLESYDDQIILHKITPNPLKIELCDILQFENGITYVCHLKPGFQGEMRTLAAQIIHSAKLISDYQQTGNESQIKKYYQAAKSRTASSEYRTSLRDRCENLSLKDFLDLFSPNKQIIFVGALCGETRDLFGDMSEFNSTIAKLATFDLIRYMSTFLTLKFQFKLMQF